MSKRDITHPIIGVPFRFTSMLSDVIVAYPCDRHWAVAVKLESEDDRWDCYCSDVVFKSLTHDHRVCRFECCGKAFECECRVLEAFVPMEQIARAANEFGP